MKNRTSINFPAFLIAVLFNCPAATAQAAEIDFSCMSYKVWGKGYVSDQFMDYDIVLQNNCPGAVYWSMCIERLDPWTNKILENHTPTGYVEAKKKARVNLHLKKGGKDSRFRNRFQEFYVNLSYAIDEPASPACVASQCEVKKREVRAQILTNEAAWERAEKSMAARLKTECPDSSWETLASNECENQVRQASEKEMEVFPSKDQKLRVEMATIDREHCLVWAGELTSE